MINIRHPCGALEQAEVLHVLSSMVFPTAEETALRLRPLAEWVAAIAAVSPCADTHDEWRKLNGGVG